jgi:RNA polymerase sigma-70 factor (ECF subfamily)
MDNAALSDEELALALQNGEEPAFDELVRRHQNRVYAVAYRVTGNREDALDVAQEVFVKLHQNIGAWKPKGSFAAWLMRLAANRAIDFVRKNKRHKHAVFEEAEHGAQAAGAAHMDTARRADASEIDERVQSALQALSARQRTVFVLRHYEGMALTEIADAMGCTVGSVKVHLFRAAKKLQKQLEDLHEAHGLGQG